MTDLSQAATTWACPKCGAVVNSGDYHICPNNQAWQCERCRAWFQADEYHVCPVPAHDIWERIAAALERIAAALEKQS